MGIFKDVMENNLKNEAAKKQTKNIPNGISFLDKNLKKVVFTLIANTTQI